ncbi:hypothetical protein [Methylophaga pinxianii]|uniref:hypothetical protein n=1 Tax=Methylophaga pinxianii TaxID=2881052 RepID=UPI001CF3217C|nr:hypothetical protein [Methylophaga pinxianii]MCB2427675.1 hypothetical protein [Methylophaga pinxianii]UPH46178.1 hypothetical protein LGT42_002535 [Methylophaga pinxianii]
MKRNEIRHPIDWMARKIGLQKLKDEEVRDYDWLVEMDRYGVCVYAIIYNFTMTDSISIHKRYLCSDTEFAMAALTLNLPKIHLFKVSLISSRSNAVQYDYVSKVYLAESLPKDESEIKFIFQVHQKHYGFDGEIHDEVLAEYQYVETNLDRSIRGLARC